jgi:hypothetical protein
LTFQWFAVAVEPEVMKNILPYKPHGVQTLPLISLVLYILLIHAMGNMDGKFSCNDNVSLCRTSEPFSLPGAESIMPFNAAQPFK